MVVVITLVHDISNVHQINNVHHINNVHVIAGGGVFRIFPAKGGVYFPIPRRHLCKMGGGGCVSFL